MATSVTSNSDRERFVSGPDACRSGALLPRSKKDILEHVYTAFRLWEASLIFPRELVKPPVYKGFSICYNFCTFLPPALGNTDVCIPQGFLLLKDLFSATNTTLISQSLSPGSSKGQMLVQGTAFSWTSARASISPLHTLMATLSSCVTHSEVRQIYKYNLTMLGDTNSLVTPHFLEDRAWHVALAHQVSPSTCQHPTPPRPPHQTGSCSSQPPIPL